MNLNEYVRIIMRRGWIVVLAALLVAGSAFVFSRLQTPVYRATQQILVKPARNDNGLTLTLQNLLNSYQAWMSTRELAGRVIDTLKLDMTPGQLKSNVTITPDRNSTLITVDVNMTNGETAKSVARVYGELFAQWRDQENQPLRLEDRITAELLDRPEYGQFSPNTSVNTLAGALLGLLLGGVFVFVIETLASGVVRRGADVERLGLPVLGSIPTTDLKGV